MQQFMPSDSEDKRLKVLLHETHKGTATNLILAQLKGAEPAYLAHLSHKIKSILKKDHSLFTTILNGEQNLELDSYKSLVKFRYILKHPDEFTVDSLRNNYKDILQALRSGASKETIKFLLLDPQRSFIKYLAALSPKIQPVLVNGVWFVADRSRALLMMQLNSSGFNLDRQQAGINAIKSALAKTDNTGMVKLDLSGPGAIAVATRDAIRNTTEQISWILTCLILFLFWFGYRSIRLAFVAGIPLITSILIAIMITQAMFGELHGIVLAFGITLLGVCLDYPLHFFSHLRKGETSTLTLKKILPTLKLGVLTSALAFIAMIGTGFHGLTQLAVFSVTGLFVALAVTRWLLPAWVSSDWIERRKVFITKPILLKFKILISLTIIGIPLFILILQNNIWSIDISQISPVPLKLSKIERELRKELNAVDINHIFLIEGDSIDNVLVETKKIKVQLNTAIEKGMINGIQTATDILPDKASQIYFQSLLPDINELNKNLSAAISGMGLKEKVIDDFTNAVKLSKTQRLVEFEDIYSTPLGIKLESLLFENDYRWYSIIRVTGVNHEKLFKSWINQSYDLKPYYISMHDSSNILMNNYRQVAWERLLGVLCLICVFVLWQAKKRREAIWLIVPVVAGVLVSLAVQILMGNLINIFHILSLLLVIGMGFDYSLFYNSEWRNVEQLQERTHAIIISALTTIFAFGSLAFSEIPILSAMGQTISIGIMTCFIIAQLVAIPNARTKDV